MSEEPRKELSDVERAMLERMQGGKPRQQPPLFQPAPNFQPAPHFDPDAHNQASNRKRGGILGTIAAFFAFLWKTKLGLVLLKIVQVAKVAFVFKGLFLTAGSMLISMWTWSMVFGWWFAVAFVIGIFVHELGHVLAAWAFGIPVSAPIFIPFAGALILLKGRVLSVKQDAIIGLAGPYAGSLYGYGCLGFGLIFKSQFALAVGGLTLFMNLFNLMPLYPMDGGRAAMAISPWLWIVGVVMFFVFGAWVNPMLLILAVMAVPRMIWLLTNKGGQARRYLEISPTDRAIVAIAYIGLAVMLASTMFAISLYLGKR